MLTPWHTQNFLRHPTRIERLLDLTSISAEDLVMDLGAGHGELTAPLAQRCRMVIAVEKDPLLAAGLQRRFAEQRSVLVREDDALAVRLPRQPYKVVANIPFDITARLVRRLTSAAYSPRDSYLVVQREAAARVLGVPRQTLFANLLKPWFEPGIVHRFQRTDFVPPPRVEVVFLRLRKRGPPLVDDARGYAQLVDGCFGAPHMHAALAPLIGRRCLGRIARELGFDPRAPASTLCFEQWLELWRRVRDDYPRGSTVTTRRPILRAVGRTIMRPARRPPSRRQA